MRIAFLLPGIGLAGGIYIVLEHARGLASHHGHDVTIVTTEDHVVSHSFPSLADLPRITIDDAAGQHFDLAVATWWHTVYSLPRVIAPRYAHFIQNLEDRFYTPSDVAARTGAGAIQALPLAFITTAGWLEAQMRLLRPDAAVYCVRSGVDKEVFRERTSPSKLEGPLRIAIEGPADVWFKGIPEALRAVEQMHEARHLTVIAGDRTPTAEMRRLADQVEGRLTHTEVARVLSNVDVLLKLSRVEGMSGPPLEAFHCGATAVITPVTGYDEYGHHGVNCMVVGYDDPIGTARTLDLLARDRRFLSHLREQAITTASQWPDWRQATVALDAVLTEIVETPPIADGRYARRLMLDTYSAYLRQLTLDDYFPQGIMRQLWWVWRKEGTKELARRVVRRLAMSIPHISGRLHPATPTLDETAGAETTEEVGTTEGPDASNIVDDESRQIFLYEYIPSSGDIVIDAGAGHGTEVVSFSRLVGPAGRVVAIEAHPAAFRDLQGLCEHRGLGNVELVHAALASTMGETQISDLDEGVLNSTVNVEPNGIWVPSRTLDEIMRELEIKHIDFLKMNIEGAEVAALEGFHDGLRRTRHVCVGCHDFAADKIGGQEEMRTRQRVRELLEEAGFNITSQAHSLPWISDYLYGERS